MELILKYFPDLTEEQKRQFAALYDLYTDWNSKINVISRKDIENLYEHHVLHSLGIAKVIRFKPGTKVMDLGTGAAFRASHWRYSFPKCSFTWWTASARKCAYYRDSRQHRTEKRNHPPRTRRGGKATVRLRGEPCRNALTDLLKIIRKNISPKQQNALPNGLICLKGGELERETMPVKNKTTMWNLKEFFGEEFFETKKVVYVAN